MSFSSRWNQYLLDLVWGNHFPVEDWTTGSPDSGRRILIFITPICRDLPRLFLSAYNVNSSRAPVRNDTGLSTLVGRGVWIHLCTDVHFMKNLKQRPVLRLVWFHFSLFMRNKLLGVPLLSSPSRGHLKSSTKIWNVEIALKRPWNINDTGHHNLTCTHSCL